MKTDNKKGLTLIEVILSIMLLGIISVSILPMFAYAKKFSKWNNIKQNAMRMAYTQVEWLKTLDYNTELEVKEKYLPPGKDGKLIEGIVDQNLFMNDINTNPKVLDGIEYRFLTNIYWEEEISTTGETIANALRKVDVSVKAKDPFTGVEKIYSIIGTLIAFEGERRPDNTIPFKIKAFSGHDFTQLTKGVKVEVYNESGTILRSWGITDEKGEAIIAGLKDGNYRVQAIEWQDGEMMSKPTGVKDIFPNQKWIFYDLVEIKKTVDPYVEHNVFVDYPGYMKIHDIPIDLINNSELTLTPNYIPPEGVVNDLNLKVKLKNLEDLKIWRSWDYEHEVKYGETIYRLVEKDTKKLWDGRFQYYNDRETIKNLTLGYILGGFDDKENIYKNEGNNKMVLDIAFPDTIKPEYIESKKDEPAKINFSLYDGDNLIPYTIEKVQKVSNKSKYKIHLETAYKCKNHEIMFILNENILDENGIGIVTDLNYLILTNHKMKNK